jgi:phage terminase large subunit-like protein
MPRFLRKLDSGEFKLAVMRMERSQNGARLVSLQDLAAYLDEKRADAQKVLHAAARVALKGANGIESAGNRSRPEPQTSEVPDNKSKTWLIQWLTV